MLLLPAIDLMGGEVVRLKRGLAGEKTVYSSDPVAFARKWEEAGADWLHFVDLDAAFSGEPMNLRYVERICAAVQGSVRTRWRYAQSSRTSAALSQRVSAASFLGRRPASPWILSGRRAPSSVEDRIAVGIDAMNGLVAVKGWTETTARRAARARPCRSGRGRGHRHLYRYRHRRHARRTKLCRPSGSARSSRLQSNCQRGSCPRRRPRATGFDARSLWRDHWKSPLRRNNYPPPSSKLRNIPLDNFRRASGISACSNYNIR